MEAALEAPGTFPLTDSGCVGNIFQGNLLGIVFVDKVEHSLDPLDITAGTAGRLRPQIRKGQKPAPKLAQLGLYLKLIAKALTAGQLDHGPDRIQHQVLVAVIRSDRL